MRLNLTSRTLSTLIVLLIAIIALTGCAGQNGSATPSDNIQPIGKLSSGDAWAELRLIDRTGSDWMLEATFNLPAAAGLDAATLTVNRADQPGMAQTLQQSAGSEGAVTITAAMPKPSIGAWVDVVAAGMRATGELFPLGLVRLESNGKSWDVVALNSAYGSPVSEPTVLPGEATAIEPAQTAQPTTVAATPTSVASTGAPAPTAVTAAPSPAIVSTKAPTLAASTKAPTVAPTTVRVATQAVVTATRPPVVSSPGALMVAITEPESGASATDSIAVSGMGLAFENQVMVELLDANGTPLAQAGATIDAEVGHIGPWEVVLEFPRVATTQTGRIRAYVTSPRDGSVAAQSTVRVQLEGGGHATATPAPISGTVVEITSPVSGSVVRGQVVVRGKARVFESQFTLQARDAQGAVLAEKHVIFVAEPGELGDWEATLDLSSLPSSRPIELYAFATSAKDGSVAAYASVHVQFVAS